MDFEFTQEQAMLREAFADFVNQEVAPNAAKWDSEDHCPVELFPKMGELGILGVFVPEEYGGVGLGHTERVIALEEIARHSAGLAMFVFTHQLGVAALLEFGNEAQKKKYLPSLCSGEKITGLGTTEPGGGSDLLGAATTAEAKDGGWMIRGRKCFITNSHTADYAMITAKSGTDEKGRNLLSVFLIEKGAEGFNPGRKENKMGLRGSVTGELIMDHVFVAEDQVIGALGKGYGVASKVIGEVGRASMAAISVGILRGCLEESVRFSNKRIVYGKPISKLQAIQFHIAEIRLAYEAARLLLYRAAKRKDDGKSAVAECSLAKYYGTEAAASAAKRTIELMGAYGIVNEYPTGRFLRDALTSISSGGTSEIQKLIIAGDTLKQYAV
ncbi:MAG: acyl-CoA dehydrogenase family protein [Clostridiales Family XIII bacterium]|jgi:alkylation response protein AidB-like acyl-CoA dehydrogenase|nr:acyl-CoA dehydrogenase family protein [Clostridiales Family XIII bacterium]